MKITARLAYSQVKINRSRTIWTLIAIALSTALITAVCSFAASGKALIVNLYGENFSNNGAVFLMLVIPAGILCIIIGTMAVMVISNAFRASAGERTAQFGILKSVGTTAWQITSTVMYESVFLSAVGIPIGMIGGLFVAFAGVNVANRLLGELNSLVHMMLNEISIVLQFKLAWQALLAAALVSFCVVLFSAWLPARKAAKRPAIESIRGIGEVKVDTKYFRTSKLTQRLFGCEGVLAAKSMKRNQRNFRASVVSLVIGIVLFINLGALSSQVSKMEGMIYPDVNARVIVDYTPQRIETVNEHTGLTESTIAVPADPEVVKTVTARLREYESTDIFCTGNEMEGYFTNVSNEQLTPQMLETAFAEQEQSSYAVSVELRTVDDEHYAALCERSGVPVGSTILINRYDYNDNGNALVFKPYELVGQTVELSKADGTVLEVQVDGELTPEEIPQELLGVNVGTLRLIVPRGQMRFYSWYASPADIPGFLAYANEVMDEFFPLKHGGNYMELGFTTRVYEFNDYMKIMNIAIVLVSVFVYCFVALLMLIGLTSIISTMSTNIQARYREFAVLQSVGMTPEGLKRMINFESLMCSIKALAIGLPLALVLTYIINIPIRSMFPIPYELPLAQFTAVIVAALAITWAAMHFAMARLKDKNIIETIRLDR